MGNASCNNGKTRGLAYGISVFKWVMQVATMEKRVVLLMA
jgi:hypothetical protein